MLTFCVCRLAFPAGCDCCHPFENLRREGVNEHGPVQMSGADTTVFCGQKSFGAVHSPWTARRVVAVSARARGLTRSDRQPCGMSRQTRQRRGAAAKRRCALQPGSIGLQGAPFPARQGGGSVYGHCTPGLRQDGNPLTRNGSGQRQPRWLCAEHDSRQDARGKRPDHTRHRRHRRRTTNRSRTTKKKNSSRKQPHNQTGHHRDRRTGNRPARMIGYPIPFPPRPETGGRASAACFRQAAGLREGSWRADRQFPLPESG